MKRVTAALVLLVVLATPVKAQNYNTTTGSTDSAGVKTTTPSDMNSTGSTTTTDQNNMNNMNNENGTSSSTLPKTASPLPLLSLGSLGALASSWWLSRRRRA